MTDDLSGFSLLDLFRAEAESHTATLTNGLLALEGTSADPSVKWAVTRSENDSACFKVRSVGSTAIRSTRGASAGVRGIPAAIHRSTVS